ncbi:hypothetical protein ETU10_01135 [Apibacter muscae]|uniref:hypothetical protein n=1 Tax=Apibacter muscae TaxID=2509004 RepID=UPI0011AC27AD|nr:hypothetical protein [Apibacter muscae]TWP25267.1 hypothetical protein ETU10_01135 [Apibacter muscae]
MNTIQTNTISLKKIITYTLITFILIFIGAQVGQYLKIKNTMIFVIFLCTIVFSFLAYLINKNTSLTTFHFNLNELIIDDKKSKALSLRKEQIFQYAIYYLLLKKWGYILRIRANNKNHYFYSIPPINKNDNYKNNFIELQENITQFTQKTSKKNIIDWIILLITISPILLFLSTLISIIFFL